MEIAGEPLKQASIVVCTMDRLPELDACLESLLPFRTSAVEIIVVNNGPRLAAVEQVARCHAAGLVEEPTKGVSRARNAGIRASLGSIVAFLDDDSVAAPDWLPILLAPFRDPQVMAVVGSVASQTLADPVSRTFDALHRALFPEAAVAVQATAAQAVFPMRSALLGNANLAIRREAFDRFGCFDTRFGRGTRIGSGEEPDFLLRLLLGGGKMVIEPAARIIHRHPTEWSAVRRWAFRSGCAHTAMLTKYFLAEPSLRWSISGYAASRLWRRSAPQMSNLGKSNLPRIPFLLGSLYGPLAFLLSGKE